MSPVKPIPDGYQQVTPYLCVDGAADAIEFYKQVFDVNERMRMAEPSGRVGHAELELGDSVLMLSDAYPEMTLKLKHGFDFVVVDPNGEIGLVTTGAGLSMQMIDELAERGHPAFNFCDIRTGQLRGDPTRLINVFQWIAAGRNVRSVLINFFAGITHLGEVAKLLVTALNAVPELRVPVTARLIGNGL